MNISLLHNEYARKSTPLDKSLLYRISLDRAFAALCPDPKKKAFFCSVITNLTDDENEIRYRQTILQDFSDFSNLFERLSSLFDRFEELRAARKSAEKEEYRLNSTGETSPAAVKNLLQTQALCLKRALFFVKAFGDLLSEYEIKSDGLCAFRDACRAVYGGEDFQNLITVCTKYETVSVNGFLDFRFTVNDDCRLTECALIDHRYVGTVNPEPKRKVFSFFRKPQEPVERGEQISFLRDAFCESLTVSALSDMVRLFSSLAEQLFARFASVAKELDFYFVALKYIAAVKAKNVPLCYPELSKDGSTKVTKLYDLYLLLTQNTADRIVPNDFVHQSDNGILIFGENGSGKTVYLRSIAAMQLLAQAGLPVPAESAVFFPVSQIAAQFSEGEKNLAETVEAGRFEEEVRELAAIVDSLPTGSLIFLNETFQSTAYKEGAEALCHLLRYFSDQHIAWILVSHLRHLETMLSPQEVTVLYTKEGYKITNTPSEKTE